MLHRLHRWWAVLIIAGLVICAVLLLHTLWWQDPQQVAAFDTSDAIHAVAISDDQSLIAAGDTAGQITIWQLDTRQIVQQWQAASTTIVELHFLPASYTILAGSSDSAISVWEGETGRLLRTLDGLKSTTKDRGGALQALPPSGLHAIALTSDGRFVAVGGEQGRIRIFDVATGMVVHQLQGHPVVDVPGRYSGVARVAFSGDGKYLASGADDGSRTIWGTQTWQLVTISPQDYTFGPPRVIAFPINTNSIVYLGGGSTITYEVRDILSAQVLLQGIIRGLYVKALVFAPDTTTYARGGEDTTGVARFLPPLEKTYDSNIYVERLADKTAVTLRTLSGHQGRIMSLAMSQDGQLLISGSDDTTVRVWQIAK